MAVPMAAYNPDLFQNVSSRDHCPWCCDDGIVPAGKEPRPVVRHTPKGIEVAGHYMEEVYGPCPACERGSRLEFPEDFRKAPWGKDGFWRGRPWRDLGLTKQCRCHEILGKPDQSAGSARALLRSFDQITHEPTSAPTPSTAPPPDAPDPTPPPVAEDATTADEDDSTGESEPDTVAVPDGHECPFKGGDWVAVGITECPDCTPDDDDLIPL